MKYRTLALALAVASAGLVGGQAFAQDRDVTVSHVRPDGAVVTKHVRADVDNPDGPVIHRTVRIERPDGSTVIRRTTRWREHEVYRPHRTVVIHRRYEPMNHVVVRTVREAPPAYVVNRHVTVIHDAG